MEFRGSAGSLHDEEAAEGSLSPGAPTAKIKKRSAEHTTACGPVRAPGPGWVTYRDLSGGTATYTGLIHR